MAFYYSYNRYLRSIFNYKVKKITINAGFSCPNIDGKIGTDGCIYCNNKAFTNAYLNNDSSIENQIIQQIRKSDRHVKYLAYFQPFTNTYAEASKLYDIYSKIKKFSPIIGIIIGTRADEIDHDKLSVIKKICDEGYYVSIEIGVQTSRDETLLFINRGHLFQEIINAASLIKKFNFSLGAHVILGLPMEGPEDFIRTAKMVSNIGFDIVKIHQLQVFTDTILSNLYKQGIINIMSMSEYLKSLVTFIEHLSPRIAISRMYADARTEYLIAPKWGITKTDFISYLQNELKKRQSYQGKFYKTNSLNSEYIGSLEAI